MTDSERWRVIEDARRAARDNYDLQAQNIAARLAAESVDEILSFGSWVRRQMEAVDEIDLLLVVTWIYDIHGISEVSGDSWEYWRGWLTGRGRHDYRAALDNADLVAGFFTTFDDFLCGEEIEYAACHAYEILTGSRNYPPALYEPSLIDSFPGYWTDDQATAARLSARFPRTTQRFGLPSFAR